MTINSIYGYGCSHARNTITKSKNPLYLSYVSEGCWIELLQTKHNLCTQVHSRAMEGSDNWRIFHLVMKTITSEKIKENDLIIIQWSYLSRRTWWPSNSVQNFYKNSWGEIPHNIMLCSDSLGIWDEKIKSTTQQVKEVYYFHMYNEVESYINMLSQTMLISKWAKENNVKLLVTGVEEQSVYENIEKKHLAALGNNVFTKLEEYFNIENETPLKYIHKKYINQNIAELNERGTVNIHLNSYGNEIQSDIISDIIRKRFA
jgi:hypothetical protein